MRIVIAVAGLAVLCACRPEPIAPPSPATTPAPVVRVPADNVPPAIEGLHTLRADLSELPPEAVADLTRVLGLEGIDPREGSVTLMRSALFDLLGRFMRSSILDHGLAKFSFYRPISYPRLAYWENVIVQLPPFVRYAQFEPYSGYSDDKGRAASLLAYFVYRLDRSPGHLEYVFSVVEPMIHDIISKTTYEASGLGHHTRGLLESHAHIVRRPDYGSVMATLDTRIRKHDATEMFSGERTDTQYAIYEDLGLISPGMQARLDRGAIQTDESWFASFWLRRFREGNTEAVHRMLTRLDAHYGRE